MKHTRSQITSNLYVSLRQGIFDTTLYDKVCQRLAAGQWFSLVSSTNKTDRHYVTEILLKVTLNNITLTPQRGTVVPLLLGHSHQRPPSCEARFQICWDSKILLNCLLSKEATPLIRWLLHCRRDVIIRGRLLYCLVTLHNSPITILLQSIVYSSSVLNYKLTNCILTRHVWLLQWTKVFSCFQFLLEK